MWVIGKASRRTQGSLLPVRPRDRRRLPKVFGQERVAWRCRHREPRATPPENLGKPSLWVNIKDLWYNPVLMSAARVR